MHKMLYLLISLVAITTLSYGQRSSRFGIEVTFGKVSTKIDLPRLMRNTIESVEGGSSFATGLGITYENEGNLNFRGGFNFWKSPFKPTVNGTINGEEVQVYEDGMLTYYGIYIRGEYGNKYFFIGGGFDFTVANNYNADRTYHQNGTFLAREENVNNSVLSKNFNNVVNIVVNTGFKLPIKDKYIIKPFVAIGTSFSSIYPTESRTTLMQNSQMHIYYTSPQKVDLQYITIAGYGVLLEYKL